MFVKVMLSLSHFPSELVSVYVMCFHTILYSNTCPKVKFLICNCGISVSALIARWT